MPATGVGSPKACVHFLWTAAEQMRAAFSPGRCSFLTASHQTRGLSESDWQRNCHTPGYEEVSSRFHLLVWLKVWLFLLSVIWGEKEAIPVDWKQDSVYAELLVIMMVISIYAVLTLSNKLSHSHYIISFTRVLGCQHFTDEKAEMNSGIHPKMICLVILLISWGGLDLYPSPDPKVQLLLSAGWTATLRI